MKIIKTKSFEIAINTVGDSNASKIVLFMPGRLDTKDYVNFVNHSNFLTKHEYYSVDFDPPGTWESPGDIGIYSTSSYLQAVHELIDYFGNRPTLLVGHSRGGATAMLASSNPSILGLAVINSSYSGKPSMPEPEDITNGTVIHYRDLPPGSSRTKKQKIFNLPIQYFEDGSRHNPLNELAKFSGPKLLVHSSKDEFVSLEKVYKIYHSLSGPKMFHELNCKHDYRLYPNAVESVNKALEKFINKFDLN